MRSAEVLNLRDVHKRFGDVLVLNGITTIIKACSITAIVGPNGAGKTTLLHMMSGDLTPDRGEIRLNGTVINRLSAWQVARLGVGKLHQDARVFPSLSIFENVVVAAADPESLALPRRLPQAVSRTLRERSEEALAHVGLDARPDVRAGELSAGSQKLLALARLFVRRPTLLLLDEPTAGVSEMMASRIATMIAGLRDATVVLVEHNMSFVEGIADRVLVMNEGSFVADGPASSVLSGAECRELCLGL